MRWSFWNRRRREAEIDEELAHDLRLEADALERDGLSRADAERASRRDFGNSRLVKEMTMEMWTSRVVEVVVQDLRYAIRTLRRSPAFAVAAVLTLALGIGVNAAVFMLFDRIALRPLPIKDGDRVVGVYETFSGTYDRKMRGNIHMLSYPEFVDYAASNHVFSDMAAYAGGGQLTIDGAQPEAVSGLLVTEVYFKIFGASAAMGRTFSAGDLSGPHAVAVVSDRFWRRHFGSDPDIVGKTILLNRTPVTVIGVAAPGFIGTSPTQADLWLPLSMQPVIAGNIPGSTGQSFFGAESLSWLGVVGKLRDGETVQRAQADLQIAASRLDAAHPGRRTQITAVVSTFLDNPDAQRVVTIAGTLALVAVALVLLVACANVANLLLARATSRQREMAVRLAIGASRPRLVRQLLTESACLALAGGAVGLLLAYYGLELARSAIYVDAIDLRPNVAVFVYTSLISIVASVVFGLAPALQATSPHLFAALKDEGSLFGLRVSQGVLRNRLITIQVAACTLFLVAAALLVRGLLTLTSADPGFQIEHVVLTSVDRQGHEGGAAETAGFYRDLLARLDASPGVEGALTTVPPLRGVSITGTAPDAAGADASLADTHFSRVSANYFRVLGIPLRQGRTFTAAETAADDAQVAVISDAMRRAYWSAVSPLGRRFRYGAGAQTQLAEVVGVVADVQASHVGAKDGPTFYLPIRSTDEPTVVTRAGDDGVAAVIQPWIREHDPSARVSIRTMAENVRDDLGPTRIGALSALALAALATLLAAIGIYGVTTYVVTQRTREVGIRLALGAAPPAILQWIVAQAMRPVMIGAAIGLPLAAAVSMSASKILPGVHPLDPLAFFGVCLFLAAVAFVASYLPARRATRVNPVTALRQG